jgi:dienelactone hydrolase
VLTCISVAILLLTLSSPQDKNATKEFDPNGSRGTITEVVAIDDPAQSYALYLPSQYSPDRRWPMIYVFDPFARGKTAVEIYRAAAEKYGYIVAGSNNSQNGPSAPQLAAAQAVWNDTHRRLAIDKDRVYTTGLSGGARVATSLALLCYTCAIAGVIAHGATYPGNQNPKPPANDHFLYYVAIGDRDFNYPEVVALRKKKDEAGMPYKIKVYPGPHQWAPPEIVGDAVEWLELKAMQAGKEKTDTAFVHKLFESTKADAALAEQRGDTLNQFYALHSLVSDFKGLEDVTELESKLAQLKSSKAWNTALHNEQRELDEQTSFTAQVARELQQLADDPESQAGVRSHIASVLSELRRRSKSSGSDRVVYSRAFSQLWVQGIEAGQDEFRNHHFSRAATYFELMAGANPDQPWPLVLLAEAQARGGNRKAALKSLEEALHRGLKDPHALAEDPDLQTLVSDPAFQRIVGGTSH